MPSPHCVSVSVYLLSLCALRATRARRAAASHQLSLCARNTRPRRLHWPGLGRARRRGNRGHWRMSWVLGSRHQPHPHTSHTALQLLIVRPFLLSPLPKAWYLFFYLFLYIIYLHKCWSSVSQLKERIKQDHSSTDPQHFQDNPCWSCAVCSQSSVSSPPGWWWWVAVYLRSTVQVVGLAVPAHTRISAPDQPPSSLTWHSGQDTPAGAHLQLATRFRGHCKNIWTFPILGEFACLNTRTLSLSIDPWVSVKCTNRHHRE